MILATSGLIAIYLVYTFSRLFATMSDNLVGTPDWKWGLLAVTLVTAVQGIAIVLLARLLNAFVV